MELCGNERLDDLVLKGYKIIQNPRLFCFGTDAVLLSWFADVKKGDRVADLGCGNGILELLLFARYDPAFIHGVEIQEESAALAVRNLELNGLSDRARILTGDLLSAPELLPRGIFDHVVCNPPYKERNSGFLNSSDQKSAARHEIFCSLPDVLAVAAALLRFSGRISLIHKPERLGDLLYFMREYKLEAKRLCFVHPAPNTAPAFVLLEGRRGGAPKLTVLPPLYLRDGDGEYTKETIEIYGRTE